MQIPLSTLFPGSRTLGIQAVPDVAAGIALVVDRTVANGLNAQPSTTTIALVLLASVDGGATWVEGPRATLAGGTCTTAAGVTTASAVAGPLPAGTGRLLRLVVTTTGTPVAVAGSVALT